MESSSAPRPFLKELFVIVLGVLIALAAQSLWNAASDAYRARRLTEGLKREVLAVKLDMEDVMRRNIEDTQRMQKMRNALIRTDPIPHDSIMQWWRANMYTSSPSDPVTAALLQTGDIRILSDSTAEVLIRYSALLQSASTGLDGLFNEYLQRASRLRYLVSRMHGGGGPRLETAW